MGLYNIIQEAVTMEPYTCMSNTLGVISMYMYDATAVYSLVMLYR